jgi:predicted metal-dependent enzyme (double-stranded beta helix superfamily)
MFEKEGFIESCRAALNDSDPRGAIDDLVARAVRAPGELMRSLGEPQRAGFNVLYKGEDLTILNLCWGPRLQVQPHDHRMWAVIGIYAGREENAFYQRSDRGLDRHGTRELNAGDTARLGRNVIHAVTNPLDQVTAAIHVYGGDFFGTARSEWDPQTLQERPYDSAATMRLFEESNARLSALPGR